MAVISSLSASASASASASNTLLFALVSLLAALPHSTAQSTSYDFIVVGGGTAGAAVASRLSQNLASASVLLLEAGPAAPDELKINVPGMKGSTIGGVYDWNITTVAQTAANNRVFTAPRGKVLGGCSAMNLMSYDRASAPEYDAWEELGSPGWNWNTLLAAMVKSENFTGVNSDAAGSEGPIHAVVNRVIPEHQEYWIPTLNNLGIQHNAESWAGNPLGVMYQPSSIDSAHYNRSYSANAYIPKAGSNLVVQTNTLVNKVNLEERNGSQVATGVTLADGTIISANREVILSAGSLLSPGILERSGVGEASVLSAAGVTQVVDLPGVGENLQDHLRVQTSYQLKDNYTSVDILRYNATKAAEELQLWKDGQYSLYDYTGSAYSFYTWAQSAGANASDNLIALAETAIGNSTRKVDQKKLEFIKSDSNTVPELEVIFSDGFTGTKGYPASTSALYGKGFFSLISVAMHTLSVGNVHISSSDASVKPTLNPNYLSNEYDIQALIEALKYNRKIATTAPLADAWVSEYEPGLDTVVTDEDWRNYVFSTAVSIYHPLGTCALLPKDEGGVVDPTLKVYGTSNLRVVDASIIPVLISAHIQTAVYGIAEHAADIITKAWQN